MKTKITALTLAAATAFAFTPKPASAGGNEGVAIAGAIIGGLVIGAAIAAADDHHASVYVGSTYYPPAPVYVPGGYWSTTTVNVWVPGVWVVERDRYGRDCRRYVAGHYAPRHNRVWVANNHNHGGHNNRNVGHGYGHDRRDDRRNDRHDRGNDRRNDRRERR